MRRDGMLSGALDPSRAASYTPRLAFGRLTRAVSRRARSRRTHTFPREGFGAIAQLVERLNGIQEVSGSTPLSSTKHRVAPVRSSRGLMRLDLRIPI